jgi:hypothetical protein
MDRYFSDKAGLARFVTRELLPEVGATSLLTMTIQREKSGGYFVTFAISDLSANIAIQKSSKGLDVT